MSYLSWRHNERNGVSNHRRPDCLLNRLIRRRSKKTSTLRVAGLCEGNSRGGDRWIPVTKGQWRGECFHAFDDFIMICIIGFSEVDTLIRVRILLFLYPQWLKDQVHDTNQSTFTSYNFNLHENKQSYFVFRSRNADIRTLKGNNE